MRFFWLLRPAADRDMVIGDLDEEWEERVRPRLGNLAAQRWYVRESLSLLVALVCDRLRAPWERSAELRRDAAADELRPAPMGNRPGLTGPPVNKRRASHGWAQDFRQTLNGLVRQPGFTGVAVLTLGLVALVAAITPARRAPRLDGIEVLR